MRLNNMYYSVSDLCEKHRLTQENFTDIYLNENVKLCIYLTKLKTYYFDFILIDEKVDHYEIQSCFISGLFYLTTYETCKILRCGEALVSHVRPAGKDFITLAQPRRITFDDLLVDATHFSAFDQLCSTYARTQETQPKRLQA